MVDICVENMDSDDIIETARAHGHHPCLQKLTDLRVSVSITGILNINNLFEKHGQRPISSLILIQLMARNSSLFAAYRALTGKNQYGVSKKRLSQKCIRYF